MPAMPVTSKMSTPDVRPITNLVDISFQLVVGVPPFFNPRMFLGQARLRMTKEAADRRDACPTISLIQTTPKGNPTLHHSTTPFLRHFDRGSPIAAA